MPEERTVAEKKNLMCEEMKKMKNLLSEIIEILQMSDKSRKEISTKLFETLKGYDTSDFEYYKDYLESIEKLITGWTDSNFKIEALLELILFFQEGLDRLLSFAETIG